MNASADRDMTLIEVQRGLQEIYGSGQREDGTPRLFDVALLGSGYDADVFAFWLEANGKPEELVLRLYAGEGGSEKSAREFAVLGRLREAGYPVPQVARRDDDRSPFGRPFVIMERIHGVSLGATYWSASGEHRQELQALLYHLLAQLHSLNADSILPDSPMARSRDPYAFVDDQLAALSARIHRFERSAPASLRDAIAWLDSRRSEVPCEDLAVLHGDFHPNNVLVRADGVAFVIDWSNVRLGDYRSDLAWTRLLTRADAQPDEGHSELRLYEELAGKEITMIRYFEVLACTRLLSSVLSSLRNGAAQEGMRPGADTLMRRNSAFTLSVAALLQRWTSIKMPDLEAALSAQLA
jgi:aminoglycoside phosphotransferase (APT) family kinase protein